ncbi:MAG: F0F1 ATP synthase subunit delta [Bacilli bacterium]
MKNAIIANRYASALFEIATEKGTVDAFSAQLDLVLEVFSSDADFMAFLNNPKVEKASKIQVVNSAFTDVDSAILNTVALLIERKRQVIIPELAQAFRRLQHDYNNSEVAYVYSTRPLTSEEKELVTESFKKRLNVKTLSIQNIIDDSILGGMKVRVGNTVFDGTLKGKVQRMAAQLKSNRA